MATSNERLWIGGSAVGAALVAALAWMFVISPELSNASSLNDQTASTQQQNTLLQIKTNKLRKQSQDLPKLTDQLAQSRAGLPSSSGLTDFTRQVTALAASLDVTLSQVTLGAAKAAGAGAAAGAVSPSGGGLYSIPVTLTTSGEVHHLEAFLKDLQYVGTRRTLISSIQLAPAANAKTVSISQSASATIQLAVFVAPQSAQDQAQLSKPLSKTGSN
jgi:Tfp pilus assembly protein PilO